MNKNNNNLNRFPQAVHGGQALILVMAIVLIASVVLFMVFNSGRAVNEKINLVNAADAAAYSGAQIAARQLNFMAYTNRAMIANELAIGHMYSYQMEVDIVSQGLTAVTGFLEALLGWIPVLGDLVRGFTGIFNATLQYWTPVSGVLTGLYSTILDSNNAFYSTLQYEAFKDFAFPDENGTLIEAAMKEVLSDYELRSSAPIGLNRDPVLTQFMLADSEDVAGAAADARNMGAQFCQMVLFAKPTNEVLGDPVSNSNISSFCSSVLSGSETSDSGSPNNPVDDDGAMLDVLRGAVLTMGNTEWIRDRNSDYRILGFRFQRRGSTIVDYDPALGQLNWRASADSLRVGDPIFNIQIHNFTPSTNDNVGELSREAADTLNENLSTALGTLRAAGLCEDEDDDDEIMSCADLLSGSYGGLRRYAYLNSNASRPVITAFLSQSNCSDDIGVDDVGARVEGWHDNLGSLENRKPVCDKTVYAVAQAEVFFERPPCEGSPGSCNYGFSPVRNSFGATVDESPNLFNPFWQVRVRPLEGN